MNYDFTDLLTYELMPGCTNPLAVPVIQGDVNRDGVCDGDDITKIAAVFGDDDWIFSNSFDGSPEGSEVDPNTQTKPWDVDGTGDNGIEASDMQWVLNFQGDTTGYIVGVQYDSTTPASTGVYLNSNAGVTCSIETSVFIPSGRTSSTLLVGDTVEITVKGQLTNGANTTTNEENGIMQFVHDVNSIPNGVFEVLSVETLGSFNTTRDSLQQKQGTNGDLMDTINGYTTSFTEGLSSVPDDPNDMYKITLSVIGAGTADVSIHPASETKFAASTPGGIKIGHTDNNGDPATSNYPVSIPFTSAAIPGDITGNGCVDLADFARLSAAWLSVDPSSNWDADCDIASPAGSIGTDDLEVLVENWLVGCGP